MNKMTKRIAIVLLFAFFCQENIFAEQVKDLEYSGPYIFNCGLNCTLGVLVHFKKFPVANSVCESLGCGNNTSRAVSFFDISNVLQKYDLKTFATKSTSFDDLKKITNDQCLAIIQLGSDSVPHFVISFHDTDGEFYYQDYPSVTKKLNNDEIQKKLKYMTGNVLFVYANPSEEIKRLNAPSTTILDISSSDEDQLAVKTTGSQQEIENDTKNLPPASDRIKGGLLDTGKVVDIGVVSNFKTTINVPLEFSNIGENALTIQDVKGACSCFQGWKGQTEILPGRSGVIDITFDPKRFDFDSGTVVLVTTNDPIVPSALISIKARKTEYNDEIICFPRMHNYGRCLNRIGAIRVTILIPKKGQSIASIKKIDFDESVLNVKKISEGNVRIGKDLWSQCMYEIAWRKQPGRHFSYDVTFETDHKISDRILFQIKGDFISTGKDIQ